MADRKILVWLPILCILICNCPHRSSADGAYFTREVSVAVSADQRALTVRKGKQISSTFSTGCTGNGEEFAWIIPTPVPLSVEDVNEARQKGERAIYTRR